MKKYWLFTFSVLLAFTILIYSKKNLPRLSLKDDVHWKTFVKNPSAEISAHKTTSLELIDARIPSPKRTIASETNTEHKQTPEIANLPENYLTREQRVLIGDIQQRNYQDDSTELEMRNTPNSNWKDLLGSDLLRFQEPETKVLIKEEFPIIKVAGGKGVYLEQVIISYVFKNGGTSSFHALIDSETGVVVETWDKTIHENLKDHRAGIPLPVFDNSGITTR